MYGMHYRVHTILLAARAATATTIAAPLLVHTHIHTLHYIDLKVLCTSLHKVAKLIQPC